MSEKSPLISVVIPCFRGESLLAEAIESVLAQTEKDWELILVDNNASEATRKVIKEYVNMYPEKIRSVEENNPGVCVARNRGIKESRGEFISLLDDDDLFLPNNLSVRKEIMTDNPECIMSYCLMDIISQEGSIVETGKSASIFPHFSLKSIDIAAENGVFLRFPEPMPSTVFFKKNTPEAFFDNHFNPFFLEDTDFSMRMFQVGKFFKIEKSLVRFRRPSVDFLKRKRKSVLTKFKLLQNQDYFYSKLVDILRKKNLLSNQSILLDLKKMRSRWLREASFDFLATKEGVENGRFLLWRSFKENKNDLKILKHFIRSYYPVSLRRNIYGGFHIAEDRINQNISRKVLGEIFSNGHRCSFCSPHMNN